ncbi:hypothetical protein [Paradesulfitobacterium aromaticivorans]
MFRRGKTKKYLMVVGLIALLSVSVSGCGASKTGAANQPTVNQHKVESLSKIQSEFKVGMSIDDAIKVFGQTTLIDDPNAPQTGYKLATWGDPANIQTRITFKDGAAVYVVVFENHGMTYSKDASGEYKFDANKVSTLDKDHVNKLKVGMTIEEASKIVGSPAMRKQASKAEDSLWFWGDSSKSLVGEFKSGKMLVATYSENDKPLINITPEETAENKPQQSKPMQDTQSNQQQANSQPDNVKQPTTTTSPLQALNEGRAPELKVGVGTSISTMKSILGVPELAKEFEGAIYYNYNNVAYITYELNKSENDRKITSIDIVAGGNVNPFGIKLGTTTFSQAQAILGPSNPRPAQEDSRWCINYVAGKYQVLFFAESQTAPVIECFIKSV